MSGMGHGARLLECNGENCISNLVIFSFAEYSWRKLAITKEYRLWFHIRGDLFY